MSVEAFDLSYAGTGFEDHKDERRADFMAALAAKTGRRWMAEWDTARDVVHVRARPQLPPLVPHPGLPPGLPWHLLPVADGVTFDLLSTSHLLVVGATNSGKALALDTPIATPQGWTTMGALSDGDEVFDEVGRPTRVVQAHAVRHGRPCYEVEFDDGTVIVADGEHLWETSTSLTRMRAGKGRAGSERGVRTTAEIAQTLQARGDGAWNHAVMVAEPLQYPVQELPLDPYLLGAWLGDGASRAARLSCHADDAEHWQQAVHAAGFIPTLRVERTCTTIGITTHLGPGRKTRAMDARLRALGILGNKQIPATYLRASIEQRRALLAGLLDTDGNVGSGGGVEYTGTNAQLVNDVFELALGLGFKVTRDQRPCAGRGSETSVAYRVRFTAHEPVFRLPRKQARQRLSAPRARSRQRYIVAVRPVASVPVRCITVDSPSHLYLAGHSCVPTHNTAVVRSIIVAAARSRCRLWLGDPKRVELLGFRGWPGVDRLATTDEQLDELAHDIHAEMERRYAAFEEDGVPLDSHDPILLVIDEYEEFVARMKAYAAATRTKVPGQDSPAQSAITSVLRLARKARIHVVIGTQRPDASWFGGSARDNLQGRVMVGRATADAARMLFGRSDVARDVPAAAKGRITAQMGDGEPVEAQAWWTPDPGEQTLSTADAAILERLR